MEFTKHDPDWAKTLQFDGFKQYARERFQVEESDEEGEGEAVRAKPPRKVIAPVEIELDDRAIPIWPTRGLGVEWNLETQKHIVRDFIREHYSTFSFQISQLPQLIQGAEPHRTRNTTKTRTSSLEKDVRGSRDVL